MEVMPSDLPLTNAEALGPHLGPVLMWRRQSMDGESDAAPMPLSPSSPSAFRCHALSLAVCSLFVPGGGWTWKTALGWGGSSCFEMPRDVYTHCQRWLSPPFAPTTTKAQYSCFRAAVSFALSGL